MDIPHDLKNEIWTTTNGDRLWIKTMTDSHIMNCLKKFENPVYTNYQDRRWIPILNKELDKRGYVGYIGDSHVES